jgi:RNA polymerase sigma-70 factor (ECF subfamily)
LQQVPEPADIDVSVMDDLSTVTRRALELVRMEFEVGTWEAVCLVLVAGQSPAEVAERLGMSTNAVYKAKARVMRRVREKLGDLIK